jgi:4-azaleucine resistance transporter AzlC
MADGHRAPPSVAIDRPAFRRGVRAGAPFAAASILLSVSFGALAVDAGFPTIAAVVMSAVVFAGSLQLAALSVVTAGCTLLAALGTAALAHSRFLPMGIALGPSLPGGPLRRGLEGQATVDASWAMAAREDGTFDRSFLLGATAIQYVAWVAGTAVGAFGGDAIGDTDRFGLDAVYPTFFLVLLIHELRSGRGRGVASAGALIALLLIPFTPPGVPVMAASLAALVGLRRRGLEGDGEGGGPGEGDGGESKGGDGGVTDDDRGEGAADEGHHPDRDAPR